MILGQVEQDREPACALDEGADRGLVTANNEVAFPVSRDRPVLDLGRPVTDLERVLVGAVLAPLRSAGNSLFPLQAQLLGQVSPQVPAGLNVEGLVDRLVTHLHTLIIREGDRQH